MTTIDYNNVLFKKMVILLSYLPITATFFCPRGGCFKEV